MIIVKIFMHASPSALASRPASLITDYEAPIN